MRNAWWLVVAAACGGSPAPAPAVERPVGSPVERPVAPPPPPHAGPPAVAIDDVVETLYGVTVHDPYRWLETDGSATDAYFRAQADYAAAALAALPDRAKLRARLGELDDAVAQVSSPYPAGDRVFYYKAPPSATLRSLYVRDGKGVERVLVDPPTLGDAGHHVALDWFAPSYDGALVAYGLSIGGSEDSTLHVLDVATGKVLPEAIDRTQYAGVQWSQDHRSFFYWREQPRLPGAKPEERYFDAKTYLHVVGSDPATDQPVFGNGVAGLVLPRANWAQMITFPGSRWAFGVDGLGVEPESSLYLAPLASVAPGKTTWQKIVDHSDGIITFDVHGDDMYALTHARASRFEIVHIDLRKPNVATADVVVPASQRVITNLAAASDALYVTLRDGAVGHLLRVPYGGGKPTEIALPIVGGPPGIVTSEVQAGVYIDMQSWAEPRHIYHYDPKTAKVTDTGLQPPWPTSNADIATQEVSAISADGTEVPLSIVTMPGAGTSHPTLLGGYGAYGASQDPGFDPLRRAWLERGGVIAIAHVRGGGEYGEDWHRGGQLANKQHTIDDFVACAKYLVDQKYTTASKLAGQGTSAGGILIGGAITQHPELFGAALVRVGDVNMTRHERGPSGAANIPEFGTATTEAGFKSLYAMDAYLHVRDGVAYPAVLLTTGAHDPRVPPWMPGKMAARLQHATSSGKPVLLRVDYDAGHGISSTRTQRLDDIADEWAFLLANLR
jgi:prolyl oligopeptidase|nr:prolyl oligopeptidase family serine peptidase [Kofleriaceae bacterium]